MQGLLSIFLFVSFFLHAEGVRIVPVRAAPESGSVSLQLRIPQKGQIVQDPVFIQMRVDGFALGAGSPFEEQTQLRISPLGQTVHIVVDNHPYFAINEPAIDPFDESGYFYDTSYKIPLPFPLSEGFHTIRMFLARSYGESLKGKRCFQAISFFVGEKKGGKEKDLTRPYITYNEPSGSFPYGGKKPVLLDFYLSNTKLSKDGYRVELKIDGKFEGYLFSWQPYYLYGLSKGSHTIRLTLLDAKKNPVRTIFNPVEETISVY